MKIGGKDRGKSTSFAEGSVKLRGIEGIFSQTINSAAKFICDSRRCSTLH